MTSPIKFYQSMIILVFTPKKSPQLHFYENLTKKCGRSVAIMKIHVNMMCRTRNTEVFYEDFLSQHLFFDYLT